MLTTYTTTYLQTFFSSGILSFDGNIEFGGWYTSWIGLELFFAISLPIMILTFAGWGYFVFRARKNVYNKDGRRKRTTSEKAIEEGRSLGITLYR